jgi:hypothetical protein
LAADHPREAPGLIALAGGIADGEGLLERRQGRFSIPAAARPLARVVASRFDAYLGEGRFRYSRAV